ncbi:MAG: dTDP-4-dehydrorhamnose 3,5-epimerase family protein [Anaerohalosphaera sp.]|nr:dTDP-4-dehydrorhamnose 3,5-epimerase family protein [Anaerohalosphaera sp.]
MTTGKHTHQLRSVVTEDGVRILSSGSVIEGAGVRKAAVMPDERGRLGEIMRADDPWFQKFGQVYFTTTYPGIVKAWHYHKLQTDHFYVAKGIVKVVLYDRREDSSTRDTVNQIYLGEHNPGLLRVPAGVYHGWMCIGQKEAYIINVVSQMYNYAEPDEFRLDPHDNDIPYEWVIKDG